jgi:caa(3)-type oxidase subunit IV
MSHSHTSVGHAAPSDDPHAHGHDDHGEAGHDDHGHGGLTKYLYVFIALCVLTSASFFTYSSYWPWHATPAVGWAFMMAVSCTKAMLVILFFMHVKYEASWKYVLTIPASVMAIFLMLALIPDVGRRYNTVLGGRTVAEERLEHMAEPRDVQAIEAAEEAHH